MTNAGVLAVFCVCVTVLAVLCVGDPDILDGLSKMVNK